MFYPCHKKNKNKNKNPPPKSIRRGCTRRLKWTIHGLLAEFRGLGVHVTRTTRTTRRTKARAKFLLKLEFDTKDQVFFVYEAISDVGKTIKIIGDTGATIGLANGHDLEAIGPYDTVGTTKISGVANKEVAETQTISVSLTSRFDNKWQPNKFEAAVLSVITHVNAADHTRAVVEALKALMSRFHEKTQELLQYQPFPDPQIRWGCLPSPQ